MPTLKEKLGALIDMDKPNLSNIERGKRFMTAETLEKIANALKTTERELFNFNKTEPEKYLRQDIIDILDAFEEKDLKFILEIISSYKKLKK